MSISRLQNLLLSTIELQNLLTTEENGLFEDKQNLIVSSAKCYRQQIHSSKVA